MYSDLLQPNVIAGKVVAEPLHVENASVPTLDAVATRSDDGKQLAIALVNRHPDRAASWKLSLGAGKSLQRLKLTVLSGDSTEAYNDIASPNRVVPETREVALENSQLQLPPHSIAIATGSIS
jgi:alpha-N-arabinofuranosidase